MGKQRRWSESDRRGFLAAHAESGLSLKAFAAAAGVPYTTLAYWRQRGDARPRLVPVEVERAPGAGGVEVVVGDVVIRVPADADDALLVRVVRALRTC